MKKLLVLALVGMMTFTGFTFADEPQVEPETERPAQEQRDKKEAKGSLSDLVKEYAPELFGEFTSLESRHDAIHNQLENLKERVKAEALEKRQAFKEEIKAALEAEEITKEEVRVIIEGKKAELLAEREATKAQIEALKAAYGLGEGQFQALREGLKAYMQAEDAAGINSQLHAIVNHLSNHVDFDYAKYDLLLNK